MTGPRKPTGSSGSNDTAGHVFLAVIGVFFAVSIWNATIPQVTHWWDTAFVPWWTAALPWLLAGTLFAVVDPALAVLAHRHSGRWIRDVEARATKRQPVTRGPDGPEKPTLKVNGDPATRTVTSAVLTMPEGTHPREREVTHLADLHGRDLYGAPAVPEVRVNSISGRTEIIFKPPVPEVQRDPIEADLEAVATQALPQTTGVQILARDRDGNPERVALLHQPSLKTLTQDTLREQIEGALAERLGWPPHTFRMMWSPADGRAVLERWEDPLAKPQKALAYQENPDVSALPIGITEHSDPFLINLTDGRHLFVAGATGAGKSSVVQGIVRAGAPLIGKGLLQLRGVDPKGGAELGKIRPMFYDLAAGPVLSKGPAAAFELPEIDLTTTEGARAMLAGERARQLDLLIRAGNDCLMRAYRLGALGIRKLEKPTVEEPYIWVIVDEAALLTAYLGTKQEREAAQEAIAVLVTQGRAWGVHLIALVQDPRMKTMEIRNLFPVKIGLRLDRKEEIRMVLSDSAADNGARCDRINPKTPGVLYKLEDGNPKPVRARPAFVSDADIEDMVTRFPYPDWTPPPMAIGPTVEDLAAQGDTSGGQTAVNQAIENGPDADVVPLRKPAKKAPAKKAAAPPAKKTPARRPTAIEPVVMGWDDVTADQLEPGDWTRIPQDGGGTRDVRIQVIEATDDEVVLKGFDWSHTAEPTDTMHKLHMDD